MRQFPLRNLFLNSIVLLIIFSNCSPLRGYQKTKTVLADKELVRPIADEKTALIYKSQIKIYNKRYSGLVVLKQTDSLTSHLTFITEVGMKIFDFEIRKNEFNLVYIFAPLDKPKTKKLLEKDMKLLLLHTLFAKESTMYTKEGSTIFLQKNPDRHYYYSGTDKNIKLIKVKGLIFKKEQVNYTYNDKFQAEKITLKHFGLIRLRMEFNRINKLAE